jgi:hypothetical protein
MRLLLLGDDEAVLEILSDLSRHLDYFEVSRLDESLDRPLDDKDHVLIASIDHARGERLLSELMRTGTPGFAAVVPDGSGSPGSRAIVAAAQLVAALQCT